MSSTKSDLKLLGTKVSPFVWRVIWALKLKGLEYEFMEEDLSKKSPLLLEMNPVDKTVPVLIHEGKPICESLIILQYIDETWTHNPMLPKGPFQRASARFWAKFSEEKFSYATNTNTICPSGYPKNGVAVDKDDIDKMQFAVNLEFLEAEFFLWASYGYGLDKVAPNLPMGGPPPIGVRKANLDPLTHNIIMEFANQEVGHLRALNSTVGIFPRPLLDLTAKTFAELVDEAFGHKLVPPFDPYRDSLSYMLSSYVIPYVGLVGYVGTNPNINGYETKRLLAGLLGVESGQDAVIRTYLYERAMQIVPPYKYTVADFTARISELRNKLGKCGNKDEGIFVPPQLGAENRTRSNVLSADFDSISYKRTPAEILRIVYMSGDEHVPGGFYPNGANGKIAREFLK